MVTFAMLAQVIPPPLDPLAGWGSLFLQGGSFGLLCYIIGSLGPKVMKEARDEREKRDDAFSKIVEKMEVGFEQRQKEVLVSLVGQVQFVINELARNAAATEKLLTSIKSQNKHDVDDAK
jgi:hypothetical protein